MKKVPSYTTVREFSPTLRKGRRLYGLHIHCVLHAARIIWFIFFLAQATSPFQPGSACISPPVLAGAGQKHSSWIFMEILPKLKQTPSCSAPWFSWLQCQHGTPGVCCLETTVRAAYPGICPLPAAMNHHPIIF